MNAALNTEPPGGPAERSGPAPAISRARRFFVSLGLQVTVLIVFLVATVASGIYLGLVHQSRITLLSAKEAAADLVVKLTSLSVAPAVVFEDEQEMQRALANLARNPDVSDAELWNLAARTEASVDAPLAQFHRVGARPLGRPAGTKSDRTREADSLRLLEPVVDVEGKLVAVLLVRFSTAREAAAMAQLARQILFVAAATALCLAIAILLAIDRIVVRPVRRLEQAALRLTRGERYLLEVKRGLIEDEVGRLADKFGDMAEAVRDRELRLGVRNAELTLILDSVDQGFLTARLDGTLLPERSAIVGRWVGALPDGATLWSLAARIEPEAGESMALGWEQVIEGVLPEEVALDQLPKRLTRDGQHFRLAYHPGRVDGRLQHVVVVMTDETAEIERQRSLAEQQEFSSLVERFVKDRRGFFSFWSEASKLVERICDGASEVQSSLRRDVHTLKGSARFFKLSRISDLCHELETAMAERGNFELTPRERGLVRDRWQSIRGRIEPVMNGTSAFLEMSREQYDRLLDAASKHKSADSIEQLVRGLRRESVQTRLECASEVLEISAAKLNKTTPKVVVEAADLRVPPGPWAAFWSNLPHVLNNAVDHGLESDNERTRLGKPVPGTVSLTARLTARELSIEVHDDGRGIDWERLRRLALDRGLPSESRHDLEQALFLEGFSLRERVSEVSGRGVGLPAMRAVVSAMGGKIELDSSPGVGTTWRFRFPASVATDGDADEEFATPLSTSVASASFAQI